MTQPSKTQKKQKRLRKRGTSENVMADKRAKFSKLEKQKSLKNDDVKKVSRQSRSKPGS